MPKYTKKEIETIIRTNNHDKFREIITNCPQYYTEYINKNIPSTLEGSIYYNSKECFDILYENNFNEFQDNKHILESSLAQVLKNIKYNPFYSYYFDILKQHARLRLSIFTNNKFHEYICIDDIIEKLDFDYFDDNKNNLCNTELGHIIIRKAIEKNEIKPSLIESIIYNNINVSTFKIIKDHINLKEYQIYLLRNIEIVDYLINNKENIDIIISPAWQDIEIIKLIIDNLDNIRTLYGNEVKIFKTTNLHKHPNEVLFLYKHNLLDKPKDCYLYNYNDANNVVLYLLGFTFEQINTKNMYKTREVFDTIKETYINKYLINDQQHITL